MKLRVHILPPKYNYKYEIKNSVLPEIGDLLHVTKELFTPKERKLLKEEKHPEDTTLTMLEYFSDKWYKVAARSWSYESGSSVCRIYLMEAK